MIGNVAPETWVEVSTAEPCKVCGKTGWCRRSPDESVVACRRNEAGKIHRYGDGSVAYIHKLRDDQPGKNGRQSRGRKPKQQPNRREQAPGNPKNVDLFDRAYRLLIDELTLSDSHRQSLRDRGLSDDTIDSAAYRSLPGDCHQVALKLLMMLGSDFRQVPGFRNNGGPTRINSKPGLFIPVRDADNRLVAIKVKPDDPGPDKKYCYLTSRSKKTPDGPSPGSPVHVPFGVRGPCHEVRITEGELKADVVFHLTGMPTISIPGVGSWRKSISVVKQLGAKVVRLAFDADARTNEAVASAQRSLYRALVKLEYDVIVETWPLEAGKGIDDLLASGGRPEVLSGSAAKEYVETTCISSSSEAQDIKVAEADDDPHRLARVNLDRYAAANDGATIKFWRDECYIWKGNRYRKIPKGEFVAKLNMSIKSEFDRLNIEEQENLDKESKTARKVTKAIVSNVLDATKGMTLVPSHVELGTWLDDKARIRERRNYVAMENGILDVDSLLADSDDVILPHSSAWFSTVRLPYRFDPQAECSRWNDFLQYNLEEDQERIAILQEWAGYCLLPDTGQQKFVVLEGEGANGKSVYFAAIEAMLGTDNVSHVPLENFHDRFSKTQTLGKLANISPDAGEMDKQAEGSLKSFTAGERMMFDRKNLDAIEAYPTARLMIGCNNRPRFSDKSDGIWRRMILIPFRVHISERKRIKNMDKCWWWERSGELSGIFWWAIKGLDRLLQQGGFTFSTVSDNALNSYRDELNPAGVFLRERYIEDPLITRNNASLEPELVYDKFKFWCSQNGYATPSITTFGREVSRKFPSVTKVRKQKGDYRANYYVGMRELNVNDEFDGHDRAGDTQTNNQESEGF